MPSSEKPNRPRLLQLFLVCAATSALWLFPEIVATKVKYALAERSTQLVYQGVLSKPTSSYAPVSTLGYAELTLASGSKQRVRCVAQKQAGLPACKRFIDAFDGKPVTVIAVESLASHPNASPSILSATDEAGREVLSGSHVSDLFWFDMLFAVKIWLAMVGLLGLGLMGLAKATARHSPQGSSFGR